MDPLILIATGVALALLGARRAAGILDGARGADWGHPWLNRLDGLNRLFCRRYHRLSAPPLTLPERGPALVVANHVSGLDPLVLIAASPRPLRFLIAREEYERPLLRRLYRALGCIPVDRGARPDRALRAALRALECGEVIALFPHGRIHLDHERPARLKGGMVWLARRARVPVFPLRIEGVSGAGRVFGALLMPSRVRLTALARRAPDDWTHAESLDRLAAQLLGVRAA